ncbi:unnamed protein product, partial [Trichobilharzia regenti]
PLTANKAKACIDVTFSPRQVTVIWEKRQAATGNATENVVGGNATIQLNTTQADVLSTDDFTNNFVTTYNTTNTTSTIQLFDVQIGRKYLTFIPYIINNNNSNL